MKQGKSKTKASSAVYSRGRKPERGATRREETQPIKWGRYVLIVSLMTAVVYSFSLLDWKSVYAKVYQSANRPLANITIEGEFKFVSKVDLQQRISSELNGRFVDIDLQEIKTAVEENPWVDYVNIERIWPDSLLLKVVEHRPIARWNDDGFINHEGVLIKTIDRRDLSELPLLSSNERSSSELAKNYEIFSTILDANGLKLRGLEVDERMSWKMDINDQFTVVLGRDEIQQRLQNFLYVYKSYLENKKHNISQVDMRYERGLAVAWQDESEIIAAHQRNKSVN